MQYQLDILKQTRNNVLKILKKYSNEVINETPKGFNNNLIWNLGHIIVTQQLLCYSLSGNKPRISNDIIEGFRKGTKPNGIISAAQYDQFKDLAHITIEQFQEDYASGLFKEYKSYTTSYGITLNSIEEAMQFNLSHEAMHLGYCIALDKVL